MQGIVDILLRRRTQIIDEVRARISDVVLPTPEVDEALLEANLELLLDGLVELVRSGTSTTLHERLGYVASRSMLPLPSFMRASYLTIAVLRGVVLSEGGDYSALEPLLVGVTIAAGDAYSAAYQSRLLELQEQRLSREAEADRLRAISHLVIGVAHELNTPLEIINQAAELVARDGSDDIREAAQLIRNNVTRASRLIRQFRGLSVSETADAIQPVDVARAVPDAILLYRRTSVHEPKLDVEIVDQIDPAGEDPRWHGYPLYFTHVLLNLLSNADHHAYRDAGGPVEILLARHDDRLHVTVVDRGVGISKTNLDNVLHPFFTTGRSRGRVGLGMAVVYNLVTAGMHGTLRIDSQEGVGTRVFLDLPWHDSRGDH